MHRSIQYYLTIVMVLVLTINSYGQLQPYTGGLNLGTLPDQGVYLGMSYLNAGANDLYDTNGDKVTSLNMGGHQTPVDFDFKMHAIGLAFMWVSDYKILGGNYFIQGMQPIPTDIKTSYFASTPQGPLPLIDSQTSGFFDLVFSPFSLSWKNEKFDAMAGLYINFPIGNLDCGASNRWGAIPTAGITYYFDENKLFSISTKVSYEINGAQLAEGIDQEPGNDLVVEWGIGKMFVPFGFFGIIGVSDFQVTEDEGIDIISKNFHTFHSIGAEYSTFIPPMGFGIMARYVTAFSANDGPGNSLVTIGFTKTLY